MNTRYDRIGEGYATRRAADPELEGCIVAALGDARSVVNVGAGTGSYEPRDRSVIAVEPSHVMAAQRPPGRPAVRGTAQALPLHDQGVDAAMTVLSLHHWHPDQEAGVRELCRVARNQIAIVTIDARVSAEMWLMAEYLHEVRELDLQIFPAPEEIVRWLDRPAEIDVVKSPRDSPDHNLISFWAHPERVLDPEARAATSGFARMSPAVVERVVHAVRVDLRTGAWDARHGALRSRERYDAGLRLIRAARR